MMNEDQIKILLDDLKTVYLVGYKINDLDSEAEKWAQIQILEQILTNSGSNLKQSYHNSQWIER